MEGAAGRLHPRAYRIRAPLGDPARDHRGRRISGAPDRPRGSLGADRAPCGVGYGHPPGRPRLRDLYPAQALWCARRGAGRVSGRVHQQHGHDRGSLPAGPGVWAPLRGGGLSGRGPGDGRDAGPQRDLPRAALASGAGRRGAAARLHARRHARGCLSPPRQARGTAPAEG